MTAIIRLILAVVLFLASLLTVFPPISYFLWEASIAVGEYGHVLAISQAVSSPSRCEGPRRLTSSHASVAGGKVMVWRWYAMGPNPSL